MTKDYMMEITYSSDFESSDNLQSIEVDWESFENKVSDHEEVEEIEVISEKPKKALFIDFGESGLALGLTKIIYRFSGNEEEIKNLADVVSEIVYHFIESADGELRYEGEASIRRKLDLDADKVFDTLTKDFEPADDYVEIEFRTMNRDIIDNEEFVGFFASFQRHEPNNDETELYLKSFVNTEYPSEGDTDGEELAVNMPIDEIVDGLISGNDFVLRSTEEEIDA